MGRPRTRTEEDIRQARCRYRATHRKKRWKVALAYLEDKHCQECGEEDILVLEFDHINDDKEHEISEMISRSIGTYDELSRELEKCRVVCRNCHVRKHHQERNTLKWQYTQELRLDA